jgi:hypothetical protein
MKSAENHFFPLTDPVEPASWRLPVLVAGCCLLSLALYLAVFCTMKKPGVGIYFDMAKMKLAHLKEAPPPRLLLLGDSNIRMSHRAELLEKSLGIPVTNGGLTGDFSLLFFLEKYEEELRRGDTVYIAVTYSGYFIKSRAEKYDYIDFVEYEKDRLWKLPPGEQLRALFSFDLGFAASTAGEITIRDKRKRKGVRNLNAWGDQIGTDRKSMENERKALLTAKPEPFPDVSRWKTETCAVEALGAFLDRCRERGIRVIGGLPTHVDEPPVDPKLVAAIRKIYEDHGAFFIEMPNRSEYPRDGFADSFYHLHEEAAVEHTAMLAEYLRPLVIGAKPKAEAGEEEKAGPVRP